MLQEYYLFMIFMDMNITIEAGNNIMIYEQDIQIYDGRQGQPHIAPHKS